MAQTLSKPRWRTGTPTPGFKGRGTLMANARPPAVPTTLKITIEEYFAAAAVIGLIGAQAEEPDKEWVADWAITFGQVMARKARPTDPAA